MGILNWIFGPRPKPVNPAPSAELLTAVNVLRARGGLPLLVPDPTLQGTAAAWAASMAASRRLTHGNFQLRMSKFGIGRAGECIAYGYPDATATAAGWYEEPDHYAIMMSPSMARGGGAVARTRSGTPYWCLDVSS